MSWYARVANVFRSRRLAQQLDDELGFHVAECIDDLVAGGVPESEARREALRRFGNYTIQKERTRDMSMAGWLDAALGDLRYGLRQLRLNPGFAAVAVLSLMLGIGANTAIFQLIDAIRLRSLPAKDPWQLAAVDAAPDFFVQGWYSARNRAFTYAQYERLRAHQQAFSAMLAFGNTRFNLSRGGDARYAEGLYVSSNFLRVLGVTPVLGRDFLPERDERDCSSAGAVLSYSFWQRELAGNPAAIGRMIYLDGRNFPILGVAPADFFGLEPGNRFDVAVPLCADSLLATDEKGRRLFRTDAWWLTLIGRLKPGWSVERASNHLRDLSPAVWRETLPESYRPDAAKQYLKNKLRVIAASAGVSSLRRAYENPLWILLAMTGLVLLTACANLANLLLARASAREREIAVRQAIGASRPRLIGQLLAESLLLAGIGGILGAVLAHFLSRILVSFLSGANEQIHLELGIDWRMFAFTALLALLTCLLFGLAPALRATRAAPAAAMRGGRGATTTRERNGLRRALVISQVAFSLILLVAALLFGRSLRNLLATDTGIGARDVIVAMVDARLPKLEPERRKALFKDLEDRIGSHPGVSAVAAVELPPFSGYGWNGLVHPEGDRSAASGKQSWFNRVSPGYFRTMETPLLAGREFDLRDDKKAPRVAIVNEAFAKSFFNAHNPVGRTFRVESVAGKADSIYQIVGLVRNTKYNELREEFRPIAFFPVDQNEEVPENFNLVIRARGLLSGAISGVRDNLSQLDPALLVEFRVLSVQIRQSVVRERLMASLSGGFGLLAGLLSTLGLYGVMSYMVVRRRNEIGVRIALGASGQSVIGLVLKEAVRLLFVGLALGLAVSFALSRYAESLLFGLKANDALTIAAAAALVAGTALLAGLVPARRAARLDPAVALRDE